jgi:hypothetical protein
MHVGELLATLGVLLCGRGFPSAFCSVHGGKRVIEVSKTVIRLWRRLKSLFFNTLYFCTAVLVFCW